MQDDKDTVVDIPLCNTVTSNLNTLVFNTFKNPFLQNPPLTSPHLKKDKISFPQALKQHGHM
ncbi:hypothetical protein E2C01_088057 [Portunus trituberculatus]|uniref:Uncharacterized protein n=1 Tax=Portunus trituberculatus TaxID=210409 RepID=A0A5B7JKY6_PORTR|nr:hypothetical protein [Portunus trituberculatus]